VHPYRKAWWPVGLAAGLAALSLILTSDHADDPAVLAAITLLLGWSFIGSGLVAWSHRPENPFGRLMVAEGFAWLLQSLQSSNSSVPFSIGLLLSNIPFALLAHLLLAYPRGRLESRISRAIVIAVYLDVTVLQLAWLLFYEPSAHGCDGCPANVFLIDQNDQLTNVLSGAAQIIGALAVLGTVAIFVQRWRVATPPARRALGPVLWCGGITASLLAFALISSFFSEKVSNISYLLTLFFLASIPFAFTAGLLLRRLARLRVIGLLLELVQSQAPGRLKDSLARTIGDPSLAVAYWIPESASYVDAAGQPVELPPPGSDRIATIVERDGQRIGALVHDAMLADNPELVDAVSAAAGLALENERLQAELLARIAELGESEGRLRALFEATPLAILEIELDTRVTYWNPAAERLFGWTSEEVVGRPVPFVPADRQEELQALRERLLAGESVSGIESQRLRKDGSLVDIVVSGAPVVDADGKVVRFMAVLADITGRLRAQAELRSERDFISAVVDTADALVIVTDRDGRFVRFNQACERLTGYTFEEVRGRPFWELFIAPEEAPRIRAAVGRVWAGDFPSQNENHWILRDGGSRLIAWSNTALLDADGGIEYMVSSGLDITERKRAEEEIRASRARIVEAGDAERRRLERNLHDGAQQRLVALSLALRMARSRVRSSPEAAAELLGAAGDELGQALTELRELARGIHPAVLTDRGLEAAVEALAERAPTRVDVQIAVGERLPAPIEAAAYYVVSESLTNVAKYASANAVTVSVEREDGVARVEVVDDGVGGADPTLGSGLRGLVDRVEALDGRLEVLSVPGGGTTVRAEIPVTGAL
jgi:PAS domain S-box-containing protein